MSGGKAIEDPSEFVKGLSTEELQKLLAETTQEAENIQRATAFQRFQPLPYQLPFLRSDAEVRAFIAANQIGKTATGAITTISAALGDKPIALGGSGRGRWPREKLRGKRYFVGGETFDSLRDNIIPKLREYVNQGSMLKGPPKRNAQGLDVTWRFVTGAEVHLMSYQQPTDAFEGAPWDGAWFDEPPPQSIFNAVRRGLMARHGWTIMTMTPLKEPWVLDELIRPSEDENHPLHGKVEVFGARMHDNCLLEGSRVSGRFTGGLKAFYTGPAVEVVTKEGERLRVTAQHPVLTDRGILRADQLHEGVALLRKLPEMRLIGPGRYEEKENPPDPTVEEVFEALAAKGRGVRERASLDLDGDERFFDGDKVHAVGLLSVPPERRLMIDWRSHEIGNLALKLTDPAFGGVAHFANDATARDPRGSENLLDRFPIVFDPPPPETLCFGRAAELDSAIPQAALKSVLIASSFVRELPRRFPRHVAFDEVVEVHHFNYSGHVYDFSTEVGYFASDSILVRNCADCHGGYLPHARIESFLASLPKNERKAREFGEFLDLQGLEFDYVTDETHVVPDFDTYRAWPIIEIVDPAMKRPLHVMWFTVDPDEYWYCVHAALIPNDGFRRMVMDIQKHRGFVGRQPDVAIMDQRGGQHRVDIDRQMDWFQKFHEAGLRYERSTDGHVQSLHDWLRPQFDPVKGERMVPKLRFFRSVADMDQGPLWGFRRFVWSPTDSTRKQYEQKGKDWVDCAMYARLANLTFRRLSAREAGPESRTSLASTYTSNRQDSPQPWKRSRRSLSSSYGTAWNSLIPKGYS